MGPTPFKFRTRRLPNQNRTFTISASDSSMRMICSVSPTTYLRKKTQLLHEVNLIRRILDQVRNMAKLGPGEQEHHGTEEKFVNEFPEPQLDSRVGENDSAAHFT